MNLKISCKQLLIHLCITVLIYILPGAILAPLIIASFIYNQQKKLHSNIIIISCYSLLCKSEIVYFIFAIMLLIVILYDRRPILIKENIKLVTKINNQYKVLIIYLLILYAANLIYDPSPFALPLFFLTFLSYFLITIYIWKSKFNDSQIYSLILQFFYIGFSQAIICLIQAVPIGIGTLLALPTLGDALTGTASSGTTSSSIILFSSIPIIFYIWKNKSHILQNMTFIGMVMFNVFIIILSDAKTVLAATIVAIVFGIISKYLFAIIRPSKIFFIIVISIIYTYIYSGQLTENITNHIPEFKLYTEGYFNSKYVYYQKTFDPSTRTIFQYLFGTGSGTNGSRAANALAYNMLPKADDSTKMPSIIPPKTNSFTEDYIVDLYNEEYIRELPTVSAIIASPFNSICSLFIEFGILGTLIYLSFIYSIFFMIIKNNNIITNSSLIFLTAIWIIAFIFPSLEYSAMQIMLFIFLGLSYHFKKK